MKTGQFYRGKIDGIQKHYESPGIEKLLPIEKLQALADIAEIGEHPQFFKQERALIKTVVEKAKDTDGRKGGITNHTVIYAYDPTVEHDGIKYIFDLDTFIADILAGKHRFKMPKPPVLPKTDTDFGVVDLPPPIEWETQP
jgi:hypothetical protein